MAAPDTPQQMIESLSQAGLLKPRQEASFEALTGGVSSDIWKVTTPEQTFCVKRALSKLKVDADWFAPVERNQFEVSWYQIANKIVPGSAPRILFHDGSAMLFAMEFLDPQSHKLWKTELHNGHADPVEAAETGRRLGQIHAGTAGDKALDTLFPRADIFQSIRLEPYLEATAIKHPDLKGQLFALSRRTAEKRLVLIHGDVSPKNILLGPEGPVFLDAECACIGDPAFDLAFCLNHFLLKCLWTPNASDDFFVSYEAMASAYLKEVNWEDVDELETRTASLLPGLFLARVDGKSPVEYLTDESDKDRVRRCARAMLMSPPTRLSQITDAWKKELSE